MSSLSKRDRVAMLRLPDKPEAAATGRTYWLPWALCFLLTFSTVSLLVRSRHGAAPTRSGAAPESTNETASPGEAKPARPTTAVLAPGAVVLESKGYIVAAHQIQVSPIEV